MVFMFLLFFSLMFKLCLSLFFGCLGGVGLFGG